MNKYLRYSFVALMAILIGKASAQKTVTIDFDNDYQTLFPTLAGVSSGSNDNYVADGDFTGITTSTPVDGVMVAIAPDEDAKTPSRIWGTAPRLRMYSGAFTVVSTGEPITKIEFTGHNTNFNLTAAEGTLDGKVWTGSTNTAIFMVSKNTQINKIVVTLGGGSETPDNPDAGKGLFSLMAFTKGTFTESDNQLAFDFEAEVEPVQGTGVKIPVTGKYLFDFEKNLCTACRVSVTVPDETTAAAAYAVVMQDAEKEGYKDVTLEGNTLSASMDNDFVGVSKTVIKSMMKLLLNDEEGGIGTLESPLSPNQANIVAGTLNNKEVTEDSFYVKGKIASIKEPFGAQYGNATFYISIDGNNDFTFYVYRALYLENQKWVEGNAELKVGDEVIIYGKLTNYNNTPETAQGQAYIYSLNGKTKNEGGSDTPDPEVTDITVAKALEIINALEDGKTTAEEYLVKGFVVGTPEFQRKADGTLYGNVNFAIADEKGGATTLTVFRAKDFENVSFTEETINRIKEGDGVVVRGKLQKYVKNDVMTPELTSCYLISVTPAAIEGAKVWDFTKWSDATVANLKADAAASKTSGWSDVEKKADAEAGADPTEASKDNCFWLQLEAAPADGALTANGVVIEELKGLKFDAEYAAKRSLAIAVNYPSTSLGDYAGPAYLWLGGGGSKQSCPCFTIPGVKAGSKITFEMESHKPSDARGIGLYKNSYEEANLIGEQFKPTAKATNTWDITEDCDVVVWNTSGCHIYKIEVTSSASGIQAVKTVKSGNGFIYNLAGQRVDANYKGVVIKNGQKMIQK